jgi:hypothetical protein
MLRKAERSELAVREEQLRTEIDHLRTELATERPGEQETDKDRALKHLAERLEALQKQFVVSRKETAMLYMRISSAAIEQQQEQQ